MRENSYTGVHTMQQSNDHIHEHSRQRLVFVAPHQATYQCLFNVMQEHFTNADVDMRDRFTDPGEINDAVNLVLLGSGPHIIGPGHVQECRQHFPSAAVAIVLDSTHSAIDPALIEQRLIEGVLPTTLPIDVWLAVVQLVLAGGEFLSADVTGYSYGGQKSRPATTFQVYQDSAVGHEATPTASQPPKRPSYAGRDGETGLESLTAREREILMLVSEGYQNKLIADRMALSEHTVKAHVHNLIAKLRVTNRTQAAAYLHEHSLDRSPAHSDRRRADIAG